MKTPKFKIGDIVKFTNKGNIHIAPVEAIKIDNTERISYTFTGFGYIEVYEENISLYSPDEISLNKSETPTLPKTWEDVKEFVSNRPSDSIHIRWAEICGLILQTKDNITVSYRQHIHYMQLLLLRDIYRQGWSPNWDRGDLNQIKYSIINNPYNTEKIASVKIYCLYRVLSFQSEEIRDLFLNNFKSLIQECREFI